jgi:peptide/nickel transport system permease protein
MAGAIGLAVGIVFGFVGGYYGGILDNLFKGAADVLITVPVLALLIVIAVSMPGTVTISMQALVIAGLSWMWPTRTIRAQVLTMRERAYVDVAKMSGSSGPEILFREMLPNLLPYLAASLVTAVALAILATIGMDALGLGPQNDWTLGNTLYWALFYSSPLRGMWWWWAPPTVVLAVVFVGLYLISAGLDQIANPRLRRAIA